MLMPFIVPANPPDNVTVTMTSCTEILVSWDMVPAIHQNSIITMYVVEYAQLDIFGEHFWSETVSVLTPQNVVSHMMKFLCLYHNSDANSSNSHQKHYKCHILLKY